MRGPALADMALRSWQHPSLMVGDDPRDQITGFNVWTIGRIDDLRGFGSGHFLSQPCGIMTWCIRDVQTDTLKSLSAAPVA
jgi:hypothetical protein